MVFQSLDSRKRKQLSVAELREKISETEAFREAYRANGNWYLEAKCHRLLDLYRRRLAKKGWLR